MFREVEIALERPIRERARSLLRLRSFLLLQFLLFLFCLIPLQAFGVRFLAEEVVVQERTGSPTFSLPLLARATDTQIISFRDALVHLPYVGGVTHQTREQAYEEEAKLHPDVVSFLEGTNAPNPFTDTITVQLRSPEDFQPFQEFLKRSELQSVLDPTVHSKIRMAGEEQQKQTLARRASMQFILFPAFVFALLVLLLSILTAFLRLELEHRTVTLQSLAGAAPSTIVRPLFLEALTLMGAALLITSALTSFLILSFPAMFLPSISGNLPLITSNVRSSLFSLGIPLILLQFLILSGVSVLGIHVALRMVVRKGEVL